MRAQLETIIPEPESSFHLQQLDQPRFNAPWHYHPEVEIALIQNGSGTLFVGDGVDRFQPGDILLLGVDLPHVWRSDPIVDPKTHENGRGIIIQFLPEILGPSLKSAPEMARIRDALHRSLRGLVFSGPGSEAATAAMHALGASHGWRRFSLLIDLLGCLAESAAVRSLSSAEFAPEFDAKSNERIGRAVHFILENASHPIALADVAKTAAMTRSAFCTYFRRMTGKHLSTFINEVRLANACRLLRETDRDITSICFEAGFGSVANFNHVFKQEKGMSPRAYRTQLEQNLGFRN